MNAEFIDALNTIEKDRGINKEVLIDAIESALISAYKRNYGTSNNVRVEVNRDTGEVQVFASKTVVEDIENANAEMTLEEAREINKLYQLGDVIEEEAMPKDFGRIAAQTAKQVVVQRIREAERGVIFDEFIEKENELLTAIIQQTDKNGVYVELGRTEGLLPPNETIQGEEYNANDRLKVYVLEVRKMPKGPQILVSRTHPGLVKRLFEMQVPEIYDGTVEIKAIAREAGSRTKLAVYSRDENVDAQGACIGNKGSRVNDIVEELGGEKIDVVLWSEDPAEFIAAALSPASVMGVEILEGEGKSARATVPDNQLSLAIGNKGQNARLCARLTGYNIDIRPESGYFGEEEAEEQA